MVQSLKYIHDHTHVLYQVNFYDFMNSCMILVMNVFGKLYIEKTNKYLQLFNLKYQNIYRFLCKKLLKKHTRVSIFLVSNRLKYSKNIS